MSDFPSILKGLRKRIHISQKELADALGISRSTIAMYESGDREPSFELMETIADYFNVDMNFLYGIDGPQPPRIYNDPHITEILTKLSDRSDLRALLSVYDGATEEEIAYAIALIKAKRGLM
jgi:transcriptional regulator with XRE-family HTH domain